MISDIPEQILGAVGFEHIGLFPDLLLCAFSQAVPEIHFLLLTDNPPLYNKLI